MDNERECVCMVKESERWIDTQMERARERGKGREMVGTTIIITILCV